MPQKLYHLKNTSTLRKPAPQQQLAVLLELIRHQHVLERLALLRDLELAVALAALEVVVVLDEEAVEERVLAEHLLDRGSGSRSRSCRA